MRNQKPANTDQALNVTPLIDILSNIVFFLMIAVPFVHLRMLSASIPQASVSSVDPSAALTVTVMMGDYGYRANARNPAKKALSGGEQKMDFPKKNGAWDNQGLQLWLRDIKLKAPRSDSVILTPEGTTPLANVTLAMDAVREAPSSGGGMFATFPKVVLTSLVQ